MQNAVQKTFEYNGQRASAYWNGKDYNGVKYVKVSFGSQVTNMTWTDSNGWTKNGGMPWAQQVANLLGFK